MEDKEPFKQHAHWYYYNVWLIQCAIPIFECEYMGYDLVVKTRAGIIVRERNKQHKHNAQYYYWTFWL